MPPCRTAPLAKIVRHCQKIPSPRNFFRLGRRRQRPASGKLRRGHENRRRRRCLARHHQTRHRRPGPICSSSITACFGAPTIPWTGRAPRNAGLLIKNDLAVYSSHLPLDAHPRLGNNARLCAALGFKNLQPFFFEKGRHIGWQTRTKISRRDLVAKIGQRLGPSAPAFPGGRRAMRKNRRRHRRRRGAVANRGQEGVDTFITGEGPHWTHALAEDAGLNVFYGGHYATETFGVKALAADLSKKFRSPGFSGPSIRIMRRCADRPCPALSFL